MDKTGLTGGTCYLINSGRMSTSNGPNSGKSKAVGKAYVWLTSHIPISVAVDFGPAYTPVDIRSITLARLPIVMALAQGSEDKFWVSSAS